MRNSLVAVRPSAKRALTPSLRGAKPTHWELSARGQSSRAWASRAKRSARWTPTDGAPSRSLKRRANVAKGPVETEPSQGLHCIGPQRQAGANLAQLILALEDSDGDSDAPQGKRHTQAADATANDHGMESMISPSVCAHPMGV